MQNAEKSRQDKDLVIVKERRPLTRSSGESGGNTSSMKAPTEITRTMLVLIFILF